MSQMLRKRNAKTFMDWTLDRVMADHPFYPALGGGLVVKGEQVYGGVSGVRRKGHARAATLEDRFHMGSITKPLTGYLMAVLCKQGHLSWQRTMRQTWPDLIDSLPQRLGNATGRSDWVAHYGGVTLWQMMNHSAGFCAGAPTHETEADLAAVHPVVDSMLPAKRKRYTELALLDRPYGGWKPSDGSPQPRPYCGGSISAASMAETVTGRTWEQLLTEQVFGPLAITRYTFGQASNSNEATDLWGHQFQGGSVVANAFPFVNHIDYAHAPAGAVSLSIGSWALWMKALLKTGSDAHLTQTVLNQYFGLPAADHWCTRGGLFVLDEGFTHNGNNFWHCADMFINRAERVATLAATNISYSGVHVGVERLRRELLAVGYAWPAMEHLSEALTPSELSVSAANASGRPATQMCDDSFASFWRASSSQPVITLTWVGERWLKGLALCQHKAALIDSFELEIHSGSAADVLRGAALDAITTREGLVVKLIFSQPTRAKKLVLRLKSSGAAPALTRLMVMTYENAFMRSFDISSSGALWTTDHARRVLTTGHALSDARLAMDHDTLGVGSQVRRAAGKLWAIGEDGKLWRGEAGGWLPVSGSLKLLRIAVDATNDWVWCVAEDGSIRKYRGIAWSVHPGNGWATDITVHAGKAWVIGSGARAFASTATGWTQIPNGPGALSRIAVDRNTLKLWSLGGDGRIYSRAVGAVAWVEHAGGGRGKEIAVHEGVVYVIGSSNNGLWRSTGSSWQAVQVLQPRG